MDKTFAHIQVRRDTEERWGRLNPELLEGEWGFEFDTGKAKIGVGKEWNNTDYFGGGDDIDLSQYATIEQLEGEIENRINADILLQKQIAELRQQFIEVLQNLDGIDGDQIEILVNGVVTLDQFNDLLEKLEREIAYRVKGDADLEDGLRAEKEDRQRADALIENHIARLRQDLEAIETPNVDESRIDVLENNLQNEVAYRVEGDKALQDQIDELGTYDDSFLRESLEQEKVYRIEGDKALQDQIDGLESYDDSFLRESLEQEKAYRVEGDKQAAEDLAKEIKRRENGDNDLQELVEREKAFRVQADQEQVEMIKAEKSDRQQADQAIESHVARVNDESKKRDEALGEVIAGHKEDRVNADAYLQRQIARIAEEFDKLIAGIDGIDGEEITVLLQGAASLEDLDAINEKIEREIAYRVQGDKLLLEQLQALEARFDALKEYDDSDLREKLEAEKGYRVEEDQKLQDQIDGLETPDLDAVAKAGSVTDEFLSTGRRLNLDGHKLVGKDAVTALSPEDGVAPGFDPGRLYFDGQRLLTEADLAELEQEISEAAKPVFYGPAPGPENPEDADLWYNTDSAELLISTGGDWALIGPTPTSAAEDYDDSELRALIAAKPDEAPNDGLQYVRSEEQWVALDLSDHSPNSGDAGLGNWTMLRKSSAGQGTRDGFGQFIGKTGAISDIKELTFHHENLNGDNLGEVFFGLVEGDKIQLKGQADFRDLKPIELTFEVKEARALNSTNIRIEGEVVASDGAEGVLSDSMVNFEVALPHQHREYAKADHEHDHAAADHDHDDAYTEKGHSHPDLLSFEGKIGYHDSDESKYKVNGTVWTIYKEPGNGSIAQWFGWRFEPAVVPGDRIIWLREWTNPDEDHALYPENLTTGTWHRADEVLGDSNSGSSIEEAPNDGKQYARQSEAWSEVVTPKLDGALIFKGAVDAKAQLPADPEVGHFYLVIDENIYYGWTGAEWDPAGSHVDIDLDGYVTVEQLGDLDNAPDDGEIYGRRNNQWAVVSTAELEDQIQALQDRGAVVFYQEDPPENPENGALWYNTLKWELYIWHSTGWVYVNGSSGGGGGNANLHYSDTAPENPSNGDLWYNSLQWELYIWNSTGWVYVNGGGAQSLGDLSDVDLSGLRSARMSAAEDLPFWLHCKENPETGELGVKDGKLLLSVKTWDGRDPQTFIKKIKPGITLNLDWLFAGANGNENCLVSAGPNKIGSCYEIEFAEKPALIERREKLGFDTEAAVLTLSFADVPIVDPGGEPIDEPDGEPIDEPIDPIDQPGDPIDDAPVAQGGTFLGFDEGQNKWVPKAIAGEVEEVHTVAVIVQDDLPTKGRFGKELQTGEMWFSTKTFRLHIYNQGAWMALSQ